jgi:hypothetical protein
MFIRHGFILSDRFQEIRIKKGALESCVFPVALYSAKHGHPRRREGNEDAPNLSAEYGTKTTACCVELQSDECWSKAGNQHEGHRGKGWPFRVEMARPCGKNGPAQMGTRYTSVDIRIGKRRAGRPKTVWAHMFKRVAGWEWSRGAKDPCGWCRYTQ